MKVILRVVLDVPDHEAAGLPSKPQEVGGMQARCIALWVRQASVGKLVAS